VDPQYNSSQLKAIDQAGKFSYDSKAPGALEAEESLAGSFASAVGTHVMSNSTYQKHYEIYADKNPLLASYTSAAYDASAFKNVSLDASPQTRFFRADQVQSAVLSEFALDRWYLSREDHS